MPIIVGGSEGFDADLGIYARDVGKPSSSQVMPIGFTSSFRLDHMAVPKDSVNSTVSFEHKLNTVYVRCMQLDWRRVKGSVIHDLLVSYTNLIVDYNLFSEEGKNLSFEVRNRILNEHIPHIKALCEKDSNLNELERVSWIQFFNFWPHWQKDLERSGELIEKFLFDLGLNQYSMKSQSIDPQDFVDTWNSADKALSSWRSFFSCFKAEIWVPSNIRHRFLEKEGEVLEAFSFMLEDYRQDLSESLSAEIAEIRAYQEYLSNQGDSKAADFLLESQAYQKEIYASLQTMSSVVSKVLQNITQESVSKKEKTFVLRLEKLNGVLNKLSHPDQNPQKGILKTFVDSVFPTQTPVDKGLVYKDRVWSSEMASRLRLAKHFKKSNENWEKPCTWGYDHWVAWGLGMLSAVKPVETWNRASAAWKGFNNSNTERGAANVWQQHYYEVRLSGMKPEQLKTYELQMHELDSVLENFSLNELRNMSGNFIQSHPINGIPAAKSFIQNVLNRYSEVEGKLNVDQRRQAMMHYLNFYTKEYDLDLSYVPSEMKSIYDAYWEDSNRAYWGDRDLIVCSTIDVSGPISEQWTKVSHAGRAIHDDVMAIGMEVLELQDFPEHDYLSKMYEDLSTEVSEFRLRIEEERCSRHDQNRESGDIQEIFLHKKSLDSRVAKFKDRVERFSNLRRGLQDKLVVLDGRKHALNHLVEEVQKLGLNKKKARLNLALKKAESLRQQLKAFEEVDAAKIPGDKVSELFEAVSSFSSQVEEEESSVQKELNEKFLESWRNETERPLVKIEKQFLERDFAKAELSLLEETLSPSNSVESFGLFVDNLHDSRLIPIIDLLNFVAPDKLQKALFLNVGWSIVPFQHATDNVVSVLDALKSRAFSIKESMLSVEKLFSRELRTSLKPRGSIETFSKIDLNSDVDAIFALNHYIDKCKDELARDLKNLKEFFWKKNTKDYVELFSGDIGIEEFVKDIDISLNKFHEIILQINSQLKNLYADVEASLIDFGRLVHLDSRLSNLSWTFENAFGNVIEKVKISSSAFFYSWYYWEQGANLLFTDNELMSFEDTTIFIQDRPREGKVRYNSVFRVSKTSNGKKQLSIQTVQDTGALIISDDFQIKRTPTLVLTGLEDEQVGEFIGRYVRAESRMADQFLSGHLVQNEMLRELEKEENREVTWEFKDSFEAPVGNGKSLFERIVSLIQKEGVSEGEKDRLVFDFYWGVIASRIKQGFAPSSSLLAVFNQKMRDLRNRDLISDIEVDYIGLRMDELSGQYLEINKQKLTDWSKSIYSTTDNITLDPDVKSYEYTDRDKFVLEKIGLDPSRIHAHQLDDAYRTFWDLNLEFLDELDDVLYSFDLTSDYKDLKFYISEVSDFLPVLEGFNRDVERYSLNFDYMRKYSNKLCIILLDSEPFVGEKLNILDKSGYRQSSSTAYYRNSFLRDLISKFPFFEEEQAKLSAELSERDKKELVSSESRDWDIEIRALKQLKSQYKSSELDEPSPHFIKLMRSFLFQLQTDIVAIDSSRYADVEDDVRYTGGYEDKLFLIENVIDQIFKVFLEYAKIWFSRNREKIPKDRYEYRLLTTFYYLKKFHYDADIFEIKRLLAESPVYQLNSGKLVDTVEQDFQNTENITEEQSPVDVSEELAELRKQVLALPFEGSNLSQEGLKALTQKFLSLDLKLGDGIPNRSEDRFWLLMKLFVLQAGEFESSSAMRMLSYFFQPQLLGAFSLYSTDPEIDGIATHIRSLFNVSLENELVQWDVKEKELGIQNLEGESDFEAFQRLLSKISEEHLDILLEEDLQNTFNEFIAAYEINQAVDKNRCIGLLLKITLALCFGFSADSSFNPLVLSSYLNMPIITEALIILSLFFKEVPGGSIYDAMDVFYIVYLKHTNSGNYNFLTENKPLDEQLDKLRSVYERRKVLSWESNLVDVSTRASKGL